MQEPEHVKRASADALERGMERGAGYRGGTRKATHSRREWEENGQEQPPWIASPPSITLSLLARSLSKERSLPRRGCTRRDWGVVQNEGVEGHFTACDFLFFIFFYFLRRHSLPLHYYTSDFCYFPK